MWKRTSNWLYRVTRGWTALIALTGFLLFTALVLPRQSAQATGEAANASSPDLSLWYSPRKLYDMAQAYGEQGRQAYVRARFTFDLVWPLVYGTFLTATISWLYARAFQPGSRWRLANLAPPIGVALDYLENLSTSIVMLRYPNRMPIPAALAPVFTAAKWLFVGGSFVLLLAGVGAALWRGLKRSRDRSSRPAQEKAD